MLKPEYTTQFKKDLKKCKKKQLDIEKLKDVMRKLCNEEKLPASNRDHSLKGEWVNCRECHIEPDWLLIYQVGNGIIVFERTSSHSEMFKN